MTTAAISRRQRGVSETYTPLAIVGAMTDTNGRTLPEALRVHHGAGPEDHRALATIRRALVAMGGHGFITDVETYAGDGFTEWSWRGGTLEPDGVRLGMLDVVAAVAPATWVVEEGSGRAGG